jgi:CPA1 family monovalent cation:H+ antiporter
MALSVPREIEGRAVPERDLLLVMTYVVVVFSILVQGLTMGAVARRLLAIGKQSDVTEMPESN